MLQPPSPNELADFFNYVISVLERLSIPYMVVGGFAAIVEETWLALLEAVREE